MHYFSPINSSSKGLPFTNMQQGLELLTSETHWHEVYFIQLPHMELLLFYARQLFQFWVFLDFHMFFSFLFYFFFLTRSGGSCHCPFI